MQEIKQFKVQLIPWKSSVADISRVFLTGNLTSLPSMQRLLQRYIYVELLRFDIKACDTTKQAGSNKRYIWIKQKIEFYF
jgi:hypothetical protein